MKTPFPEIRVEKVLILELNPFVARKQTSPSFLDGTNQNCIYIPSCPIHNCYYEYHTPQKIHVDEDVEEKEIYILLVGM
jgi:hypothetical protein